MEGRMTTQSRRIGKPVNTGDLQGNVRWICTKLTSSSDGEVHYRL
jgi:hypothetical protein